MLKRFKTVGLTEEEHQQHVALAEHQEHARAHEGAKAVVEYHVAELARAQSDAANAHEERVEAKVRLNDTLRAA